MTMGYQDTLPIVFIFKLPRFAPTTLFLIKSYKLSMTIVN